MMKKLFLLTCMFPMIAMQDGFEPLEQDDHAALLEVMEEFINCDTILPDGTKVDVIIDPEQKTAIHRFYFPD